MVSSLSLVMHRARLLLNKAEIDIMASMESMKAWTLGNLGQSRNHQRNGMQACMHGKNRKQGNLAYERTLEHGSMYAWV